MEQKKIDDIIDEAMPEYNELKDVHNVMFNNLTKVFKNYFGVDGKHYKKLVEFDYMIGDVPEQGKPAKMKDFLDQVGILFKFLALSDRADEITSYLNSNYGLNMSIEPKLPVMGGDIKKAEKSLENVYGNDYQKYIDDPKLLIKTIVRGGVETRELIDLSKAEIEAISTGNEDLTRAGLMKLLSVRYAKEQGKDIQGKLEKLDEAVDKADYISNAAHKFAE